MRHTQSKETVSDFMLEASCREAEDVSHDKAFFTVDDDTFTKFQALLDKPCRRLTSCAFFSRPKRLGKNKRV